VRHAFDGLNGTTIHFDPEPEAPTLGVFSDIDSLGFHPETLEMVHSRFPLGLYRHQHQAIAEVMTGQHTVVATRTSSGKSLIYSLPVIDSLCQNAAASSLFLYPQKALANDQY
jgi:DEAD/DEAH box helicase domain-containing protein